jgi:hypothetical protein
MSRASKSSRQLYGSDDDKAIDLTNESMGAGGSAISRLSPMSHESMGSAINRLSPMSHESMGSAISRLSPMSHEPRGNSSKYSPEYYVYSSDEDKARKEAVGKRSVSKALSSSSSEEAVQSACISEGGLNRRSNGRILDADGEHDDWVRSNARKVKGGGGGGDPGRVGGGRNEVRIMDSDRNILRKTKTGQWIPCGGGGDVAKSSSDDEEEKILEASDSEKLKFLKKIPQETIFRSLSQDDLVDLICYVSDDKRKAMVKQFQSKFLFKNLIKRSKGDGNAGGGAHEEDGAVLGRLIDKSSKSHAILKNVNVLTLVESVFVKEDETLEAEIDSLEEDDLAKTLSKFPEEVLRHALQKALCR